MSDRRGVMALEALVAFLLMLLVLDGGWTLVAGMARSAAILADRAESLAGSRAAAWILQEELAATRAGMDVLPPAGDSVALRAFRGTAVVCGRAGPGGLRVRWTGLRSPDPDKDSVLVLTPMGLWEPRALAGRSVARGGCAPFAGTEEIWSIAPPADGTVLLRFFERGSYHISGGALRYRIGRGGRQPLTPPTIDVHGSGMATALVGAVRVTVSTVGRHRGQPGVGWKRTFRLEGRW